MLFGISVIIPCYRSEQTVEPLVEQLLPVLSILAQSFEVILVNDGSPDKTWDAIERVATKEHCVYGINLMRNYGQHNALLCGLRAARYSVCITMDDDLQHPPEEIPRLLAKLEEGYDVVYGVPEREQHGLLRDLASQMTKFALQNAMGAEIARNISAFRVLRTSLREAFADYRSPYVSLDVLLTWATTRFAAERVRHEPRRVGQSNYTIQKLITHAFNMVTGYSTVPLQIASVIGISFAFLGLITLFYVIGRYIIQGGSVPGFPFLASVIAIFSGAQLFALGIIGEYLARMYFRSLDRPTYAIRPSDEMLEKMPWSNHDSSLDVPPTS